jgi:Tfp pilus assembly protein PilF/O-antigen ligase
MMNKTIIGICDRIVMWGIPLVGVAVMAVVSLISLNPLVIKSTIVQCGAVAIFTAWAIRQGELRKSFTIDKPLSRVITPAFAFMLSAVFSMLFVTASRDTSLEELMVRLPYCMLFLVAALSFSSAARVRSALFVFIAASFVLSAYGMVQHFGLDPLGLGDPLRIQSTFGNPNFYVGFLTLIIPVTFAAFDLDDDRERKKAFIAGGYILASGLAYYLTTVMSPSRTLHAVVFLCFSAGALALCAWLKLGVKSFPMVTLFLLVNNIFLTRSRSGQIGLGVAIILFIILVFLFVLPRISFLKTLVIAAGSLCLAGLVTAGVLHISYADEGRLKTVSERKYYVEGVLNLVGQKPFFGHGIGTFKNNYPLIKKAESWAYNVTCFEHVSNVYNEHLEILHDEGIVGLGIWIWLLTVFLILVYRGIRAYGREGTAGVQKESAQEPFWLRAYSPTPRVLLIGLVSGIVALLAGNIFSLSMRYVSTGYFFWLFLGFAAAQASRPLSAPLPEGEHGQSVERKQPDQRTFALVRVCEVVIALGAVGAVLFSIRIYLADVYLNAAVNFSKDAYTPVDAEGKVFHDMFIEGTQFRSDSLTWEKAIAAYRRSLANNPFNLRMRYFFGNAFNRRWNLDRQYNPAWGDRGNIPRNDPERAMEQYEYIIAQAPHFTEIDFELGDYYMKLGDIDRALSCYKDYKRYKPYFTKIHYMLANVYVAKKDWADAAESYKDALELNQKFTMAYLELSAVYHKLGKDDLSAEMFDHAQELSPDKVHLAMADIWQRLGENDRAQASVMARLAQDSTDARPYARLGWSFIEKKEWPKAIEMYEKAVRFNPKHAPAWVNLSNLYYNAGRIDEAKTAYEKALAADPGYVRSLVNGQEPR